MSENLMSYGIEFLNFLVNSFMLLAPMLLLGLFLAGLLHILISRELVSKWFRKDGLKSIVSSAAIGVPIPLCSCSVVPVVAEMRRKGASDSACMSFLITAPETGADSILVTNAFFGWGVALGRPIVSFVTAVVAGLTHIAASFSGRRPLSADSLLSANELLAQEATSSECCDDGEPLSFDEQENHQAAFVDSDAAECDDCGDHKHTQLIPGQDDCYVPISVLCKILVERLRQLFSSARQVIAMPFRVKSNMAMESPVSEEHSHESSSLSFGHVSKHLLKYGFVEIGDDIFFALLFGIILGGLLYVAIPAELMSHEYAQWLAYPAMVLFGVPLYICASASTPIAAALVAKGFSPGAALVFLMTGPATNTGTIAVITSVFGAKFASIYVGSVIVVTVVIGVMVDMILLASGIGLTVNLVPAESETLQAIQVVSALALVLLIAWRFKAGALVSGYREFVENLRPSLWKRPDSVR